jgi:hypothetical protein
MGMKRTTKIYRRRTPRSDEDSCPLDPNHTHFMLLDDMLGDSIESPFGEIAQNINCRADVTIKLRAEIEHAISKSKSILIMNETIFSLVDYFRLCCSYCTNIG